MRESLKPKTENESEDLGLYYSAKPPITWPSTLDYIDTQCGGFYGMTTLAAEKGTGKTMMATASAIEAAATKKWQVVTFVAEDDRDGFRDRFNTYLDYHPHAVSCMGNLWPYFVGKGQTPASILGTIESAVDWQEDLPILVVVDSINSIVNLSGQRYLPMLAEFGLWMMFARRISGGLASFLVTSETNKAGEAKGEALPFWSDVYLRLKKETEHIVSMRLDKSRRTAGEGQMGKYKRKWYEGVFVPADMDPLHIVGGWNERGVEGDRAEAGDSVRRGSGAVPPGCDRSGHTEREGHQLRLHGEAEEGEEPDRRQDDTA